MITDRDFVIANVSAPSALKSTDDEDESEESERDHDGILENLSCVGTHLYCGQTGLPAPRQHRAKGGASKTGPIGGRGRVVRGGRGRGRPRLGAALGPRLPAHGAAPGDGRRGRPLRRRDAELRAGKG